MKREVLIEAVSRRYAKNGKHVFRAVPYIDSVINNYITGQERRPNRPDGLSKAQIEGKEPLTETQKKKFEYPLLFTESRPYEPIYKKRKLDLSTDESGNYLRPDHYAVYNFIMEGMGDVIASSKELVDKDKHLFYVNDPQKEAALRVKGKREIFKLQQTVLENLDPSSFYELILSVNFNTNETYQFSNVSPEIIEDTVFEICEKYPRIVQNHFTEIGQKELYILKLLHHEIIFYRDSAFHDKNGVFLGTTIGEVLAYVSKKGNQLLNSAWSKALQNRDQRYAESLEKMKGNGASNKDE